MNSALPPPVLIGTNRPSTLETCAAHGTDRQRERAPRAAAAGSRPPRHSASSAKITTNARYSGRANAVSPSRTPGITHAHHLRPLSLAHRNDSTAPASVSVASGSLISLPE